MALRIVVYVVVLCALHTHAHKKKKEEGRYDQGRPLAWDRGAGARSERRAHYHNRAWKWAELLQGPLQA